MQHRIVVAALVGALLACATSAVAAGDPPSAPAQPPAKATASQRAAESNPKSSARSPLVDINSAGKTELKRLPGLSDAQADKIIAGRPYSSKADLVTRGIVSSGVYQSIRKQVIARPKSASS